MNTSTATTATAAQQIIDEAEAKARETGRTVKAKIPAPQLARFDNQVLGYELDETTDAEHLTGVSTFPKHLLERKRFNGWGGSTLGDFDGHVYFTIEADTKWDGQRVVDVIGDIESRCIAYYDELDQAIILDETLGNY